MAERTITLKLAPYEMDFISDMLEEGENWDWREFNKKFRQFAKYFREEYNKMV